MVIGKGGETIRGLSEEFEAQIDVDDDGTIRIYAHDAAPWATPWSSGSASMTKEVEVGDEFTGKVVKTTTFGAFVELVQGHRRPAAHLERLARPAGRRRSRTCSTAATRSTVRVVEVDKERGRIGLRLADDPEIAGQDRRGARHASAPATRAVRAAAAATAAVAAAAADATAAATGIAAAVATGGRGGDRGGDVAATIVATRASG